jgi:putative ABC transport system ATP-binding protein
VELDGQNLAARRESQLTQVRAAKIGFIFQTFNLIPTLSAAENVETALVPLGVDTATRKERARQALAEVGLDDRAQHLPSELSGGQQQRVAIARALVKRPVVLLADEPTGNLDEGTRDEIMTLLKQLWHQHGLTLVTVTHDSTVARQAQRNAVMRDGQLTIPDSARHATALPTGRTDRSGVGLPASASVRGARVISRSARQNGPSDEMVPPAAPRVSDAPAQ